MTTTSQPIPSSPRSSPGLKVSEAVMRWAQRLSLDPRQIPTPSALDRAFPNPGRPGVSTHALDDWEDRFGVALPTPLRVWLELCDGFPGDGSLIHPLRGLGPMLPFARPPGVVLIPEGWIELGNPRSESETVCMDLEDRRAWEGPGHDCPVFVSGDDLRGLPARIIAPGFVPWFLRLLHEDGRESWSEPSFVDLGCPWRSHQERVAPPELPAPLRPWLEPVDVLLAEGRSLERIADQLHLLSDEVETLIRHLQHRRRGTFSGVNGSAPWPTIPPPPAASRPAGSPLVSACSGRLPVGGSPPSSL